MIDIEINVKATFNTKEEAEEFLFYLKEKIEQDSFHTEIPVKSTITCKDLDD